MLFLMVDEVLELLVVEVLMLHALIVLLLIDEVLRLYVVRFHTLSLIFTHQLSEGAVEFSNIVRKKLSVPIDLIEYFLLVFLSDEATLDPQTLIGHLLSTVVEDLLGPDASLLLLFEAFNLLVTLRDSHLSDFPLLIEMIDSARLKQDLLINELLLLLILSQSLKRVELA